VAARRVAERVHLRFTVPSANRDPSTPLALSRIDIYARSVGYGSEAPVLAQLVHRDFLVGSIEVRPSVDPDAPPPDPAAPVDPRPAAGEVAPWSETLAAWAERPLAMTREQQVARNARRRFPLVLWPSSVTVPFSRIVLPTRYYVIVPVSSQGRNGTPSAILPVRLGGAPPVPTAGTLTNSETTLTLTWTSTRPVGAGVMIYESTPAGVEAAAPVQPTPITTGTWSTPVTFGVERCFTIRQVQVAGAVSTEGAPAGPFCRTAQDTFSPATPVGLVGVSDTGRVVLDWTAVTSADLAGYHVLRGEGADATLRPLTTVVVSDTKFVDTTVRPDVEYIYAVVAVDRAGNRSEPSAPFRVTGRKP
jgi:hypothetical protein